MNVTTTIELDPSIEARLDQLAQSTGRSKDSFLKELIAQGMDDLEDLYFAGLELERLQMGESTTRSLEVVSTELGLVD
jgi:RHH-type rel operon transcriptional repressor/antitoxin RelB